MCVSVCHSYKNQTSPPLCSLLSALCSLLCSLSILRCVVRASCLCPRHCPRLASALPGVSSGACASAAEEDSDRSLGLGFGGVGLVGRPAQAHFPAAAFRCSCRVCSWSWTISSCLRMRSIGPRLALVLLVLALLVQASFSLKQRLTLTCPPWPPWPPCPYRQSAAPAPPPA